MKKKTKMLVLSAIALLVIAVSVVLIIISNKPKEEATFYTIDDVKDKMTSDISKIQKGKYKNLICDDFSASLEDIEGVYNIEIQNNNDYLKKSLVENLKIMDTTINRFFNEEFDKSFIEAEIYFDDEEGGSEHIGYNDLESALSDSKYKDYHSRHNESMWLFGNNTSEGGYMVQIDDGLTNVWFSKYGLKEIESNDYNKGYLYLMGERQGEDFEVTLSDKSVKISELENKCLEYLNKDFILPVPENISYEIGDAYTLKNGDKDAVCFLIRRVYKGIPFECGSNGASGEYNDKVGHDHGLIYYADSNSPDTLMGFGKTDIKVNEIEKIDKILDLNNAMKILSDRIGTNSTYNVKGAELIYREEPAENNDSDSDCVKLTPKWKIVTLNQNDDKYTLFYVDAVTFEVTERFEYYYE